MGYFGHNISYSCGHFSRNYQLELEFGDTTHSACISAFCWTCASLYYTWLYVFWRELIVCKRYIVSLTFFKFYKWKILFIIFFGIFLNLLIKKKTSEQFLRPSFFIDIYQRRKYIMCLNSKSIILINSINIVRNNKWANIWFKI
jgi:hypothetical protein